MGLVVLSCTQGGISKSVLNLLNPLSLPRPVHQSYQSETTFNTGQVSILLLRCKQIFIGLSDRILLIYESNGHHWHLAAHADATGVHHGANEEKHSILEDDSEPEEGENVYEEDDMSSTLSIPNESIDFDMVYALHSFAATVEGQANVVKGDSLFLMAIGGLFAFSKLKKSGTYQLKISKLLSIAGHA